MRCRGIYVWHRERHDLDGQDFMLDRPISGGVCLCKSRRCPSRIRADNRYGAARAVLPIASSGPLRLLAAVPKWSCNGRDGQEPSFEAEPESPGNRLARTVNGVARVRSDATKNQTERRIG